MKHWLSFSVALTAATLLPVVVAHAQTSVPGVTDKMKQDLLALARAVMAKLKS